jgi:UDP-N-acetylglucosamine diphosphorylase / glucose-1-phosphate thymidylyltransferase / UDP-N-acetylgalactosamine diphosphorylase / glucosamine-1-phosphate N-acetyltransferase / galactosamine-1-phosphate N-acetyltransferase
MDLKILLFDDARAKAWQPFRLTRPVGSLRFGCMTLERRAGRALGNRVFAYLGCDDLAGFRPGELPHIAEGGTYPDREFGRHQPHVVMSSRALPLTDAGSALRRHAQEWADAQQANTYRADATHPITLTIAGTEVGWLLPPLHELPTAAQLNDPGSAPIHEKLEVGGNILEWPWHLVEANARQVALDLESMELTEAPFDASGNTVLGHHRVSLAPGATIEPGVVLDARDGPIRLEKDVYVQAPARLTGPLHVAEGSQIFGGVVGHSSIGPVCKLRGEIDSCVFVGYDNKAHDGYLGHALVGEWVNLGAMTTNSDLKNNYSSVRVHVNGEDVDTGLMKVGCLLGDHVKTGIGTLITTGAVIGAASNVFGGGITPRSVPPFSWGTGSDLGEHEVEKFLATTKVAMARRDIELTGDLADLYRRASARTRAERGV